MISKTKTEEYLRAVELPENTKSYTRIPHGAIIDQMRGSIEKENLEVEYELYKGGSLGQEALGFIHIKSTLDSEMGMTFNWTNSYNKKLKFGCSVGAFIYDLNVPFIYADNTITWSRKHTGTANVETKIVVEEMIAHSEEHFKNIIKMKKAFTSIKLSEEEMAGVLGEMFFAKDYFGPEQANLVKAEMSKPKYNYAHQGTLWHLHQMLMVSVVDSDPTKWYSQQIKINTYLILKYNIDVKNETLDEAPQDEISSYFTQERIDVIKDESFTVKEHLPEFKQHTEVELIQSEKEPVIEVKEEIEEVKEDYAIAEEVEEQPVFEEEEEQEDFNLTDDTDLDFEELDQLSCPECGSRNVIITLHGTIDCDECETSTSVNELTENNSTAFTTEEQHEAVIKANPTIIPTVEEEFLEELPETEIEENPFEIEEEEEDIDEPKSMNQYRELITDFFNPESLYAVDDRAREDGYIVLVMKTGETLVL